MNHEQAIERDMIGRYRLGRLTAEDTEAFEDHMIGCVECQTLLEADSRIERSLRAIAAQAASTAARAPAVAAVRWRAPVSMLAAAVALAVALGTTLSWHATPMPAPQPQAGLPTFQLALTRGSATDATEFMVPADAAWYALELEVPATEDPCCQVVIVDAAGRTAWTSAATVTDDGLVRVLLPRDFLAEGGHRIALRSSDPAATLLVEHPVSLRRTR